MRKALVLTIWLLGGVAVVIVFFGVQNTSAPRPNSISTVRETTDDKVRAGQGDRAVQVATELMRIVAFVNLRSTEPDLPSSPRIEAWLDQAQANSVVDFRQLVTYKWRMNAYLKTCLGLNAPAKGHIQYWLRWSRRSSDGDIFNGVFDFDPGLPAQDMTEAEVKRLAACISEYVTAHDLALIAYPNDDFHWSTVTTFPQDELDHIVRELSREP